MTMTLQVASPEVCPLTIWSFLVFWKFGVLEVLGALCGFMMVYGSLNCACSLCSLVTAGVPHMLCRLMGMPSLHRIEQSSGC